MGLFVLVQVESWRWFFFCSVTILRESSEGWPCANHLQARHFDGGKHFALVAVSAKTGSLPRKVPSLWHHPGDVVKRFYL